MKRNTTIWLLALLIVSVVCTTEVAAQTATAGTAAVIAAQDKHKSEKLIEKVNKRLTPIVVQNPDLAPQIVTILHRLNGLKVFRLLARSNEELGAIANLDEAFKITTDVHTNVITGVYLDDGRTIAAWLPEAEAEIPPMAFAVPRTPAVPPTAPAPPAPTVPVLPPLQMQKIPGFVGVNAFEADLKIVTREGKKLSGRYVGLDGVTGLSVISVSTGFGPKTVEAPEASIAPGQHVRVLGPQPAPKPESAPRNAVYVRIGETHGTVVSVNRSPSGAIARIKIKSSKLSNVNVGGVAINDQGQTLGIVDAVQGTDATLVPISSIRSAAKRVVARQSSVPRPWLGVRGEPIGAMSLAKIQHVGWQLDRARELMAKSYGILLTSVIPGSPAALNNLKPGDVILSVNDENIRSAEEFTWLFQEAKPGAEFSFKIASPDKQELEALQIKLGESPDPFYGLRAPQPMPRRRVERGSLFSQGIETIAIKPKVAARFGATGGLLVVYVQPTSEASKAGIKIGDVIEAVDGQVLTSGIVRGPLLKNPGTSSTLTIVRNKQKLQVTIATHE